MSTNNMFLSRNTIWTPLFILSHVFILILHIDVSNYSMCVHDSDDSENAFLSKGKIAPARLLQISGISRQIFILFLQDIVCCGCS